MTTPLQKRKETHAISAQASFVEEQVRNGYSIADVNMWQALCRQLTVKGGESEDIMRDLLLLSATETLNVLAICNKARRMGYKKLDEECVEAMIKLYQGIVGDSDDHDEPSNSEGSCCSAATQLSPIRNTPPSSDGESTVPAQEYPHQAAKRRLFSPKLSPVQE